jgi:hypothetical protein
MMSNQTAAAATAQRQLRNLASKICLLRSLVVCAVPATPKQEAKWEQGHPSPIPACQPQYALLAIRW